MSARARRVAATVLAVAAGLGLAAAPAGAAVPTPGVMDALGDSITRAVNTCAFGDCPAGSWATGDREDVDSHARRLTALRPGFTAFNDARSGARMDDFVRQARLAVTRDAEYVTLLMGANDACTPSLGAMTPVATYRRQLDAGLDVLDAGIPDARILVLSVPDIFQLYSVFRDDDAANAVWQRAGICQSMLANPRSDAPADVERRAAALQRVRDFNAQLETACAARNTPAFPDRCTYDGGEVFGTKFSAAMVSRIDYFHPSLLGQQALAAGAWARGIPFVDPVAPPALVATPPVQPQPQPRPAAALAPVAAAAPSVAPTRPLVASGGRRSRKGLSALRLGPADRVLRALDVRLGAGVRLQLPRTGPLGVVTFLDARGHTLRRLTLSSRAAALKPVRGRLTLGAPGRLTFGALPAGTAGVQVALASGAVHLSGTCRAPGWLAEVRDAAGARSIVRAARRC